LTKLAMLSDNKSIKEGAKKALLALNSE